MHLLNICHFNIASVIDVADSLKEYSIVNSSVKIQAVNFHKSNHLWIFEIYSISELIFKMPPNADKERKFFEDRCINIQLGRKICQENQLFRITVPEIDMIDSSLHLLAEKKLNYLDWKELYTIYNKDIVLESLKQFVIFICRTGLFDAHKENYKFLADGSGIGLHDLECMCPEYPEHGLRTFMINLPEHEFFDPLKEIIRNNVAINVFQKLFES